MKLLQNKFVLKHVYPKRKECGIAIQFSSTGLLKQVIYIFKSYNTAFYLHVSILLTSSPG